MLIFSQFTAYLRKIRARQEEEGFASSYLDGTTPDRASVIAEFKEGAHPLFLISLKAGGVGLNLTEADYVFLLDPWWNPATEAQAIDRTHRIGQTMPVTVYRLVSADTIEDKVLALQDTKRELMNAYLSPTADASGTRGIPPDPRHPRRAAPIEATYQGGGTGFALSWRHPFEEMTTPPW